MRARPCGRASGVRIGGLVGLIHQGLDQPAAARRARLRRLSARVVGIGGPLAPAAGLRCGMPPRPPGKS